MNEVIMSGKVQPGEEMLLGLIQCHFAGQFLPPPLPPETSARSIPRDSYQPNGIPGHLAQWHNRGRADRSNRPRVLLRP